MLILAWTCLSLIIGQCYPYPQNEDNSQVASGKSCGIDAECALFYQCPNNTIIKDGFTLIDIRLDEDDPNSCPTIYEVCCNIGDKVTDTVRQTPPVSEGCGFRNFNGVGFRITGDNANETEYGEFPWMVAVLQANKVYRCGGSLIHPSVVLTGAHCVYDKKPEQLTVRAGDWDSKTEAELYPNQDRAVSEIIVHDKFNKRNLFNDIALLFTAEPFELSDIVKPVCLPPAKTNFDASRCFATGWGTDSYNADAELQTILKKIELPIVPYDRCQKSLRTTRLGKRFELHQSFLCAGGEPGKDTCIGDGGSPLVCPIEGSPDRFYQAGIVAWGIGCGGNVPGVYAGVLQLRSWLDQQLMQRKINSTFFTA